MKREQFELHLEKLVERAAEYGLEVIGAIVILLVGWWLADWARRLTLRALDRIPRLNPTVRPFLGSIARYAVLVVTVIAVLAQFGVQTTSIIAVLGAAGLAIGLALQGTLQNVAAGVMLLLLRPFEIGDFIDAEGTSGTVNSVGLFTTELTTFDGIYRSVPNAQLWGRGILNYTRNPTRRLDIPVGIAYAEDIEQAFDALLPVMRNDGRVLAEPAPQVMVLGLGESSVDLNLRCWTARQEYWQLRFDLFKEAKQALDAAGITIPFPQRTVHVQQHGGAPADDVGNTA